jgi:hypothetical protein
MKNKLFLLLFILLSNLLQAQPGEQYSIKLEGIYGNIIPHDQHVKALILNPVTGGELSLEFQTMGNKPWQQFNGFPIVGVSAVWLNLGNPLKLGNAFAVYPYISYPLISTNFFKLNIKAGAGVSYLTKTYYNTNTDSTGNILPSLTGTNGAIGSNLNVYFSGGGNLEIPIADGISLIGEYTWNHMSNGSAVAPNSGLNLLNGFVGLKYTPNYNFQNIPDRRNLPDMNRSLSFEVIVSGGFRQLYYLDSKTFPIGSVVMGVYRPISNFYRMGLALDAFYDGAYDGNTLFKRTYITTDELKNKIRVGISWQNELILGRLTAGIDLGLYLYDPLKNLSPYDDAKNGLLNKPLIYSYNIEKEDGWFYSRATLKYAINNQLFVSLGLKTHLQKAEFIEWGLGYRL